jgi:hypothetical protein
MKNQKTTNKMKPNFIWVLTIIVLVVAFASVGFAHEPGYEMTIPQVNVPPRIDGKLDDAAWKAVEPVEWGNINTGGVVNRAQFSKSWAVYDDKFIYVAFENMEPNTGKLTTVHNKHDVDVWMDDENEISIEPNHAGACPPGTYPPCFQIIINAANVTYDNASYPAGPPGKWEPGLESATQVYKDRWVLEVKIPFKDLGFDKAPIGATWGWNFNRHIMAGVDIWTEWSTTGEIFATPNRFGDLTFGMEKTAVHPSGKFATAWGSIKGVQ